ncbi:barstar family protein [Brevibacillus ginsengisoli]|uniref:barstar family protein n=1 Tax=Brevibacillus ginsengisoli TaxID=363854 RepID=UPI003CF57470
MDIGFEAKVCHIGFSIGYFTKEYIISWSDKVISTLEVPEIPDNIFDLSMAKKTEDISGLLTSLISLDTNEDEALKTIVGMICLNYRDQQLSLYETCELLYRLSNYVDSDHVWNTYLYDITGRLEIALDGYGDVEVSLVKIERFLVEHEGFSTHFDPTFVPTRPLIKEFKPKMEHVIIDVSKVFSAFDLQLRLKNELDFPDFYGMNWNAFWDAITGMVKMPQKLTISGWSVLMKRLPDESKMLEDLLLKYKAQYNHNFKVSLE